MPRKLSLRILENRVFWAILFAGMFAAYTIWCGRNRLAGDVAWYLYAIKRIQAGAVLYRDLHDMNPPIVYLMYMPLGWINSVTGWRIDWLLYGALAAGSAAAVAWIWQLPGMGFAVRGVIALSVAFAGLTLNRFQFGQRDPICAILFAGLAIAVYLQIEQIEVHWTSWAGVIMASLGMAMKPHFLAPWALVLGLLAVRRGVMPVLRMKEAWMPVIVSIIAWTVAVAGFPDFRAMVALAYRYYSNVNVSVYEFAPLIFPLAVAAYALLRKTDGPVRTLLQISALSTFGFAAACMLQRKGFLYHMAPVMYWGTITAGVILADMFHRSKSWRMPLVTASVMLALPFYSLWTATLPPPAVFAPTDVEAFVTRYAAGKSVLALSTDLRTGFPLILEAGAINTRPDAQMWMLGEMYRDQVTQADESPTPVAARYHTRPEMDEEERHVFNEVVDIVVNRRAPIILVQTAKRKWGLNELKFDFIEYFSQDEGFRKALSRYKPGPVSDDRMVLFLNEPTLVSAGGIR